MYMFTIYRHFQIRHGTYYIWAELSQAISILFLKWTQRKLQVLSFAVNLQIQCWTSPFRIQSQILVISQTPSLLSRTPTRKNRNKESLQIFLRQDKHHSNLGPSSDPSELINEFCHYKKNGICGSIHKYTASTLPWIMDAPFLTLFNQLELQPMFVNMEHFCVVLCLNSDYLHDFKLFSHETVLFLLQFPSGKYLDTSFMSSVFNTDHCWWKLKLLDTVTEKPKC